MLQEYALEPELLNNWPNFRYFIEKFGPSKGRLISEYPIHWKSLVYKSLASCPDREKKMIEVKLQKLDKHFFRSRMRDLEPTLNWLSNALSEHSREPFHAIIAKQNPQNHRQVLESEYLDETHPLWVIETQKEIKRTASEMGSCIKPLLQWSQEFVFVDPYFFGLGGGGNRHLRPLEEFLKIIIANRTPNFSVKRLEYHTSDRIAADQFENRCNTVLPRIIPQGLLLDIIIWPQGSLHNRYVLTERGGVSFGMGLDDCDYGNSIENDDVILLDQPLFQTQWNRYSGQPVVHTIRGIKSR